MSIIPELILQQVLVRGLRLFRENLDLVDMLFRNLTQKELQPIREFIRDKEVDISLNYPDQGLSLPAIVILLKNDVESQAFLGEVQQASEDLKVMGGANPFVAEELLGDQTILGAGSTSTVGRVGGMLVEPMTALGGAASELWAPLAMTSNVDPFEEVPIIVIMEGTGFGQRRLVTAITPSNAKDWVTIEVDSPWDTIPDDTSVFKIISSQDTYGIAGEPSKLFTSEDAVERLGQIYKSTYLLEINGPNTDSVIFLYYIIKAILVVSRRFLAQQGILNFVRMSGNDLAPVADYFPTVAFRRSLSIEFDHAFDIFAEVSDPLAKTIYTAITTLDSDEIESVNIETNFTIT